jgi:hypothetical protein
MAGIVARAVRRHPLGEHPGVVPGVADELGPDPAHDVLGGAGQRGAKLPRELSGVAARGHGNLDLDPGSRLKLAHHLVEPRAPGVNRGEARRPRIDPESHLSGDRGGRIGFGDDSCHRDRERGGVAIERTVRAGDGQILRPDDQARRRRQRIAAL